MVGGGSLGTNEANGELKDGTVGRMHASMMPISSFGEDDHVHVKHAILVSYD